MKYSTQASVAFLIGLIFLISCKGSFSKEDATVAPASGDTLIQNRPAGNGKTYRMRILSNPDVIESGKPVVFSFKPEVVGMESQPVPLDADRGYEIHLMMVSSDLSWFDHRHPGLSDLGVYEQSYIFEKGGTYHLYAEYKPTGSKDTFQVKSFPVNGFSGKSATYPEARLSSPASTYNVVLAPAEGIKFESDTMQTISATISKDGVAVDPNSLGDYLGGKGHMVLIGVREKSFLHVHPEMENGNLIFHINFPQPGMYRAWFQFQTNNIVHTADFIIKVDEGSMTSLGKNGDQMHADQH